ncbi:MAG: rod shape-determining protein MreD [Flavobacteriaceae bacterium]|nr:rod shape-determining protein MreD [Flavobacteriaceae bacterium]
MNRDILKYGLQFIVVVLIQVLILNQIDFTSYNLDPYLYIIFILLFPVQVNRSLFIFLCFLLGLTIDMFSNSGGIHATSCLIIGFIRPVILKFSFGTSYEFHQLKITQSELGSRITYFTILIVIHHLLLFIQDYFSFTYIIRILLQTLYSSIFTLFLIVISSILLRKRAK